MNALPEHRRAINARTYSQPYRPSDYAAVEHYPARDRWLGVALAVVIGITLAASLVAWWSS